MTAREIICQAAAYIGNNQEPTIEDIRMLNDLIKWWSKR